MRELIILGSTGSIGRQTLEIIEEFNDIKVVALACGRNIKLLREQIIKFKPSYVSTKERCIELEEEFKDIIFYYGDDGLNKLSLLDSKADLLNCLVGSVGLVPTLNALKTHKKVLLSNKETLVIGGEIVKEYIKKYDGKLYPIDSEHTGLWELVSKYGRDNIESLTITASGGAFRDTPINDLPKMKKEDALKHPNWQMGPKITIDSATMMNKVFELIEAHYLFDMPMDKINAVINRESKVHAMVTLKDNKVKMAIGDVSMRNPIIRALYYPELRYEAIDDDNSSYKFDVIDEKRYPSINLAKVVMDMGGLYPTILNAANEASVDLFLNDEIEFTKIYEINALSIKRFKTNEALTISNILKYDKIVKDWVYETYRKED